MGPAAKLFQDNLYVTQEKNTNANTRLVLCVRARIFFKDVKKILQLKAYKENSLLPSQGGLLLADDYS